jgi:hypothetical protein
MELFRPDEQPVPPKPLDQASIDWTLDLLDMLNLPQPDRHCTRCRPKHFRSVEDNKRRRVARVSCRCWNCPACAPILARTAGMHYGRIFLETTRPLFLGYVGKWTADTRHLCRRKASWVRVRSLQDVVISTVRLSPWWPLYPREAVMKLGDTIRGIMRPACQRFRPITSSRDWALSPRAKPKWKIISITGSASEVVKLLKTYGVEGQSRLSSGNGWNVGWAIPDGWTQAKIDALDRQLSELFCRNGFTS